jgi:hypothetical protein
MAGFLGGIVSSQYVESPQPFLTNTPSLSWFAFSPLVPEAVKNDLKLTSAQVGAYGALNMN